MYIGHIVYPQKEELKKGKTKKEIDEMQMQSIKKYMDNKTADEIIAQAKKLQPEVDAFFKNRQK